MSATTELAWRTEGATVESTLAVLVERCIALGAEGWFDRAAWLLGLTNYNQRHPLWRSLARWILGPPITVPHLTGLAALLAP